MKINIPSWLIIAGGIGLVFTGKVITQFAYYPMYQIPEKTIFKIGEIGMNFLFISFALIFLLLFINNLSF